MSTCVSPDCLSTHLTFDSSVGADVCTLCGTVASNASEGLEVLGRVLEGDSYENGRSYLGDGGVRYHGAASKGARRVVGGSEASKEEYAESRRAELERYIRSVLNHFERPSLFAAVKLMFQQTKAKTGFKWGARSNVIAVACIYIVSRERDNGLKLLELASLTEFPEGIISRAQQEVKLAMGITTVDSDPFVFLEPLIIHFASLLRQPTPVLSGSKKTTWTKKNLDWLRSLKLTEVRTLAEGLLAFIVDINLAVGRAPEQVACAIVIVAMEGVARRLAPVVGEIMDDMAFRLKVAAFTIAERYRELHRLLLDFAPRIPWIGSTLEGKKKKDMVAYTEDIVKFRKALDAKKKREEVAQKLVLLSEVEGEEGGAVASGSGGGKGDSDEDEAGGAEEHFPDPITNPKAAKAAKLVVVTPTAGPNRVAAVFTEEKILHLATQRPNNGSTKGQRPLEYMRQRPGAANLVRTLENTANSLLSPFITSPITPATPASSTPSTSTVKQIHPGIAFAPHSAEAIRFRQQMLAGHEPLEIFAGVRAPTFTPTTRLDRLLWERGNSDGIADDELFGEDELEGFLRSSNEVIMLEKSGRYESDWKEGTEQAQAAAMERMMRNSNRRKHALRKRTTRKRQKMEMEEEEMSGRADRQFTPRPRATKLLEGINERLEELWAEEDAENGFEEDDELAIGLAFDEIEVSDEEGDEQVARLGKRGRSD